LLAGNAHFYHDECERLGRAKAREMYLETLEELRRTYAEFPEVTNNCGSLRLAGDADEMKDIVKQYNMMKEDGLPVQWYVGTEGEGLLIESDGTFNPLLRCRQLALKCLKLGAKLYGKSKAVDVSGTEVVCANGQKIKCKRVVVAVDGAIEALLPELQNRVRTTRLQMLATEPTNDVQVSRAVYRRWGYDYY